MCIIIKQDVLVLQRNRQHTNKKSIEGKSKGRHRIEKKIECQEGFTLPELLVSLCIVCFIMGAVWQWGTVMQRTSTAMAQNQEALWIADQIYAGFPVQCPENWGVEAQSVFTGGALYETTVHISAPNRSWEFFYIGPVKVVDCVGD